MDDENFKGIELVDLNTKSYLENKLFKILKKKNFINPIDPNDKIHQDLFLFFENYIIIENKRLNIIKKLNIVKDCCHKEKLTSQDTDETVLFFKNMMLSEDNLLRNACSNRKIYLNKIFNNWNCKYIKLFPIQNTF